MRTMHYRVLALAGWLLILNNLERVSKQISDQRIDLLTPYAYVFVALVALIMLALPAIHRIQLPLLLGGETAIFLFFKALLGYPIGGEALPLTITEICAFLITGLLVRYVILAIWEFERSIVHFTIKHVGQPTKNFAIEQGEMYQEVRRAREFNRPLTLMAIKPQPESYSIAVEKMVEEVQQVTMKQYVLAALAKTIEEQLGPYSIIAQNSDHFFVLLPETSREDCPRLTSRLQEAVRESNGLDLQIGTASLSEIETFDELIEAAHDKMRVNHKARSPITPRVTSRHGHVTSQ